MSFALKLTCLLVESWYFYADTMPAFVYTVALGVDETSTIKAWLVQLLCTHHKRFPKVSACEVAESAVKQNFGAQAIIGSGDASGILPAASNESR